jgi:hypothetical protein
MGCSTLTFYFDKVDPHLHRGVDIQVSSLEICHVSDSHLPIAAATSRPGSWSTASADSISHPFSPTCFFSAVSSSEEAVPW